MSPARRAEPGADAIRDGESRSTIERMLELRKQATGSELPDAEAISHERSKAHGRQLARERGEAVPPTDDEERE